MENKIIICTNIIIDTRDQLDRLIGHLKLIRSIGIDVINVECHNPYSDIFVEWINELEKFCKNNNILLSLNVTDYCNPKMLDIIDIPIVNCAPHVIKKNKLLQQIKSIKKFLIFEVNSNTLGYVKKVLNIFTDVSIKLVFFYKNTESNKICFNFEEFNALKGLISTRRNTFIGFKSSRGNYLTNAIAVGFEARYVDVDINDLFATHNQETDCEVIGNLIKRINTLKKISHSV